MTRYWLRFGQTVIPLGPSPLAVGRSASCELVLEDSQVSRRHLRLAATPDGVLVEDLSTNGVFIGEQRLPRRCMLVGPTLLFLGNSAIEVVDDPGAGPTRPSEIPTAEELDATAATLPVDDGFAVGDPPSRPDSRPAAEATKKSNAVALVGAVAERFLASGMVDAAERVVSERLEGLLDEARAGKVDPEANEPAAHCAIKLASATGKASWVDYALELCTFRPDVLPSADVDELYALAHKGSCIGLPLLRNYVAVLEDIADRMGPSERFALGRLQGLVKLLATR